MGKGSEALHQPSDKYVWDSLVWGTLEIQNFDKTLFNCPRGPLGTVTVRQSARRAGGQGNPGELAPGRKENF